MSAVEVLMSGAWLSIAILAGGLARERGRSVWTWFIAALLFGPLACALLVVWPRVEPRVERRVEPSETDHR